MRLQANGASLWMDSDCEVVQRDLEQVAADLHGIVAIVGKRLRLCQQGKKLVTVLKPQARRKRARVMPEVALTSRSICGENSGFRHVHVLRCVEAPRKEAA